MGKGGMAVAGWVAIGLGGLLIYAGMTGQSLVGELQGVLSGKSPAQLAKGKPAATLPAPATPASDGTSGLTPGGAGAGSGGAGGGGGSW